MMGFTLLVIFAVSFFVEEEVVLSSIFGCEREENFSDGGGCALLELDVDEAFVFGIWVLVEVTRERMGVYWECPRCNWSILHLIRCYWRFMIKYCSAKCWW
jgi:hypothetical protein